MPALLAIDFGTKRLGFAASLEGFDHCRPLETWTRRDWRQDVARILHHIEATEAREVIVGRPTLLDGKTTASTERAVAFADRLRPLVPVPVHLWDEALTSWAADERMEQAGIPMQRRKSQRDAYSALVLLEDCLQARGSS